MTEVQAGNCRAYGTITGVITGQKCNLENLDLSNWRNSLAVKDEYQCKSSCPALKIRLLNELKNNYAAAAGTGCIIGSPDPCVFG